MKRKGKCYTMEKKFDDNDEMQIDLLELAYALKKKLWLIILGLNRRSFRSGAVQQDPADAHL